MQHANKDNKSYYMCKFNYGKIIVDTIGWNPFINKMGNPLYFRECSNEYCKGAHCLENLKQNSEYEKFNNMNKAKYDWVKLYLAIIDSLEKSRTNIDTKSLNFIEAIQLWKNLASENRKLAKENKNIYTFQLDNTMEEVAWAFERITHLCPDQEKVNEMIRTKTRNLDISDLCLGTGLNCKYGVSKPSEMICKEDFLFGKCNCIYINDINQKINELEEKKSTITNEKQLKIISVEIENIKHSRPIHFTELSGKMIPFNIMYEKYIKTKEEETMKLTVKNRSLDDMIELTMNKKPVISLGKLGKK